LSGLNNSNWIIRFINIFKRTSTAICMAWTWLDVQAFGIAWDIAKSKKLK
jgi:hypothetical protein